MVLTFIFSFGPQISVDSIVVDLFFEIITCICIGYVHFRDHDLFFRVMHKCIVYPFINLTSVQSLVFCSRTCFLGTVLGEILTKPFDKGKVMQTGNESLFLNTLCMLES